MGRGEGREAGHDGLRVGRVEVRHAVTVETAGPLQDLARAEGRGRREGVDRSVRIDDLGGESRREERGEGKWSHAPLGAVWIAACRLSTATARRRCSRPAPCHHCRRVGHRGGRCAWRAGAGRAVEGRRAEAGGERREMRQNAGKSACLCATTRLWCK